MSVKYRDESLQVFVLPRLPTLPLPPLPTITDPALRETVFTHTSAQNVPKRFVGSMFLTKGQTTCDYEKLEHVGDAIIEAVAVTLLHELYPNFRQGSAATMRDKLVSNSTLAQVAVQYGLPERIKCSADFRHTLKLGEKIQASVFEAYVAGVYYSILGKQEDTTPKSSTLNSPAKGEGPAEDVSPSPVIKVVAGAADNEAESTSDAAGISDAACDTESEAESDTDTESDDDISYDGLEILFQEDDSDGSMTSPPEALADTDGSSTGDASSHSESSDDHSSHPGWPDASSDTIRPAKTRGQAFDQVFSWLQGVFEPIARFAVAELQVEERRLSAHKPAPVPKFEIPKEWAEEDIKAVGGKATLHHNPNFPKLPVYKMVSSGHGTVTIPWKVTCTATDVDGKVWTAEATRMTKQGAANVAAWKICVAMGIIKEDD